MLPSVLKLGTFTWLRDKQELPPRKASNRQEKHQQLKPAEPRRSHFLFQQEAPCPDATDRPELNEQTVFFFFPLLLCEAALQSPALQGNPALRIHFQSFLPRKQPSPQARTLYVHLDADAPHLGDSLDESFNLNIPAINEMHGLRLKWPKVIKHLLGKTASRQFLRDSSAFLWESCHSKYHDIQSM